MRVDGLGDKMKQIKGSTVSDMRQKSEHEAAKKAARDANKEPVGYKEHAKIRSRINGRNYEISFGPQHGGFVPANPFASLAQEGYMHAHPEVLGAKGLAEWDASTKGRKLPKKARKK